MAMPGAPVVDGFHNLHRSPVIPSRSVIPRHIVWFIPALLLVHNIEEAVAMPRFLPIVRANAPPALQPVLTTVSYQTFLWALGLATVIPVAL